MSPHPGQQFLLRLVDDDLTAVERRDVQAHVERCAQCAGDLERARAALGDYLQFHNAVLKDALPSVPRPWARLDVRPERRPARRWAMWWLPAAAAFAAILLLMRLADRTPAVRAAELLRKAVAAEKAAPTKQRSIRIRSRKFTWNRAAHVSDSRAPLPAGANEIRRLLETAGYDWEDPLSAQAYSRWHDTLAEKKDRVEEGPAVHVIQTHTNASPISDASLTLGADFRAVACTLQFGAADVLEVSELQDEPSPPGAAPRGAPEPAPPVGLPPSAPAKPAGPAEELQVVAALHRIGADLGEPIEVRREGPHVVVSVTSLGATREDQVRAALSGLPAVRLQFGAVARGESKETVRRAPTQIDAVNPLLAELQNALPDSASPVDLANQIADQTDTIVQRAYAVRGLARRFAPELTGQMSPDDVATLRGILEDHAKSVSSATAALRKLLRPILPAATGAARVAGDWQNAAELLLAESRRLDEAFNGPGARKNEAAQALANLEERVRQLREASRR